VSSLATWTGGESWRDKYMCVREERESGASPVSAVTERQRASMKAGMKAGMLRVGDWESM